MERVDKLKWMHRYLLEKLERYKSANAPKEFDLKKLEETFDELSNYTFVLKRKA